MGSKDNLNHRILGTQQIKPKEFATQINLNVSNSWGVLKSIVDLCLALEEGKFLLMKDPNKEVIRLYSIPADALIPSRWMRTVVRSRRRTRITRKCDPRHDAMARVRAE